MRLSCSHDCNLDTSLATGYQMCKRAGEAGLGGDFVLQGISYGRLHREEKGWDPNFH